MKCVNENCKNNPTSSINMVVATTDGDLACCPKCLEEFEKQRDNFFDNIDNDEWYNKWMHIDE
jgi:hypothetical protein